VSTETAPDAITRMAAALIAAPLEVYLLRLYVASLAPRSMAAIRSVRAICETHLQGCYALEVIDVYEQPTLAKDAQIVAAPTLIKQLPLPLRRLIGDLADQQRVLVGLDLRTKDGQTPQTG
jgi:circadian clock protein KaiB